MCAVLLAPSVKPIAVKYIYIYIFIYLYSSLSLRLSAALTGPISVEFYIGHFYEKSVAKIQMWLKSGKNIWKFTRKYEWVLILRATRNGHKSLSSIALIWGCWVIRGIINFMGKDQSFWCLYPALSNVYRMTNRMSLIIYFFLFHVMAPTCFGNNYAIFREQLNSFWVT
jgi:hypothetical protein